MAISLSCMCINVITSLILKPPLLHQLKQMLLVLPVLYNDRGRLASAFLQKLPQFLRLHAETTVKEMVDVVVACLMIDRRVCLLAKGHTHIWMGEPAIFNCTENILSESIEDAFAELDCKSYRKKILEKLPVEKVKGLHVNLEHQDLEYRTLRYLISNSSLESVHLAYCNNSDILAGVVDDLMRHDHLTEIYLCSVKLPKEDMLQMKHLKTLETLYLVDTSVDKVTAADLLCKNVLPRLKRFCWEDFANNFLVGLIQISANLNCHEHLECLKRVQWISHGFFCPEIVYVNQRVLGLFNVDNVEVLHMEMTRVFNQVRTAPYAERFGSCVIKANFSVVSAIRIPVTAAILLLKNMKDPVLKEVACEDDVSLRDMGDLGVLLSVAQKVDLLTLHFTAGHLDCKVLQRVLDNSSVYRVADANCWKHVTRCEMEKTYPKLRFV